MTYQPRTDPHADACRLCCCTGAELAACDMATEGCEEHQANVRAMMVTLEKLAMPG